MLQKALSILLGENPVQRQFHSAGALARHLPMIRNGHHLVFIVTLPASVASSHAVTWLLWEASWRGMSTGLQVGRRPLHVQTLTVNWWTSAPEPLRLGPSEYLLRALSGCAANLDLFWQSVVERMKRYGFYFVDPRLVSIEFRGCGNLARRRFADN